MFDFFEMMFGFFEIVSGFILFFLGCLAVGCFLYEFFRASWIKWRKTEGVIISSKIEKKHNTLAENTASATSYNPLVVYKYHVDSQENIGKKLYSGFDFSTNSINYARLITERYCSGRIVDIYYNLKNPADSCLKRRMHISSWLFLLVGSIFLVLSFFILVIW